MRKIKISCIIPAYNEAKRISAVLRILQHHPMVSEIIVVNDGSTDDTLKVVKGFKNIQLINHKSNKGKTSAVLAGLRKANNEFIMLMDADLVGITKDNVTALITPIIKNEADISISLRKNSLFFFKLIGLDFVSGERVFNKNLLKDYASLKKISGYGLETFLNEKIINSSKKIAVVRWKNVSHARKSEKVGLVNGIKGELSMIFQIIRTIGLSRLLYQMAKMSYLKNYSKSL